MGEFKLWRQAQQHLQISAFHRNLGFKIGFHVSHAARCSVSTATTSGQRRACCQFSGNCTMEKTSSSDLRAWDSPAPRGSGTTWASVRELILPNFASNGEGNQTVLHCFILAPRNENFYRLSSSLPPQFPPHFQSYFSCKMNRNMFFFNKMCFATLRIPCQSYGSDFGSDEAGFCFLVGMAPWLYASPGEPLNLQPDLENIYALQRFCLSGKIIFSETVRM